MVYFILDYHKQNKTLRRGTARNSEHNASKSWWQYVVRQEVSHYSTRRAAHNMEKELIR